ATLEQLTRDAYADLHPAWAPDSRRLVFASDRFSSDLDALHMGALQLAILDTKGRAIEPVAALDSGKHINPQWSPDGWAGYFIGDPDGVPNVYRLSLGTRVVEQLTTLATGVSGITPSSPALSVSAGTGRQAITVLEHGTFNIYVREAAQAGWPIKAMPVGAAALPPGDGSTGTVNALLSDPAKGLPTAQRYPTAPYRPNLSVMRIAQRFGGVGVGPFGANVNGGAALLMTDTLGDHVVATAFQLNSDMIRSFSVDDLAADASYFNLAHRWHWGISASQTPYVRTALSRAGERHVVYRQTERRLS